MFVPEEGLEKRLYLFSSQLDRGLQVGKHALLCTLPIRLFWLSFLQLINLEVQNYFLNRFNENSRR
jgi:hypothetical protein